MIDSYSNARDEIFGFFKIGLNALNIIFGYIPEVDWQGIDGNFKQPTDKCWVRISQQTLDEPQATLSGSDLKRRYNTQGLLFIQIFIPKTNNSDYAKGLLLASGIKNIFRGKQTENCIWFTNVKIQELPSETAWKRINVVSSYQYDEIG